MPYSPKITEPAKMWYIPEDLEIHMSDETYLTVGQAAKRLRIGPQTVRDYIKKGKLPAVRLPSGHRRILESDVEQMYAETYGEPNNADH